MVWSKTEEEREKQEGIFHMLKKKVLAGNWVSAVCGRVRKVADRVKGVKRGG